MRNSILLWLFIFNSLILFAQENAGISGFVYETQSGKPIENTEVILLDTDKGVITNKKGYFQLLNLQPNTYYLVFKHIGYEEKTKKINLKQDEEKQIEIYLIPRVRKLKEVIIEEEDERRVLISRLPYIETKILKKQITETAAGGVGDLLRSSNNISGIRKGGTGIDPVIRGFKFSQLNVQIDNGLKIEGGCPNRMDPATSHIQIEDIESIEVFKGPYALRYGPSLGGVINLKTTMPEKSDTFNVHINALKGFESNRNGNKGQMRVFGGNKYVFFNISGGQKDYGNYKDGNGNEVKSEFRKYNYRGQLGFCPYKSHSIILYFEESKGRDVMFPALPMDERKDDTRLMSIDYMATELSEVFNSITVKLYKSDVNHEMDNKNRPFSDTVVAVSTIEAINRGFRAEAGLNIGKNKLFIGIDYENISKDGERVKSMIPQPGLPVKKEKLWNNALITNLGLFAEYIYDLNSFEFIGAVRVDFNNARSDEIVVKDTSQVKIYQYGTDSIKSDYINFSFSLGATKHLNNKLSLSLTFGRGVRSPDMIERFIILLPIGYDKFDYLGDPRLKPEANNQADLTLKYINEKIGLLQINGFYSLINNYITGERLPPSVQKPLSKDVLGVKQFYNAGNARLRGFELSYATPSQYKFGAKLFGSYTYGTINNVKKYILDEHGDAIDVIEIKNDALTEIPPFESSIIIRYRFFNGRFIPKAKIRMAAAQDHVSEASYEPTSPGFVVAGFSFNFYFNKYFSITGGVDNIFDKAYYEHLNRNIIGTNTNLYEPGRIFYLNLFFKI
ncbi:MAG: TonB-dependent receptor [Bacteroidales bacterium]|nr:TonB-dependent receptor [Bacteroidales bacterium]